MTVPNSPGRAQLGCDHGGRAPAAPLVSLSRLLKQKQIFLARHGNGEGEHERSRLCRSQAAAGSPRNVPERGSRDGSRTWKASTEGRYFGEWQLLPLTRLLLLSSPRSQGGRAGTGAARREAGSTLPSQQTWCLHGAVFPPQDPIPSPRQPWPQDSPLLSHVETPSPRKRRETPEARIPR